MCSMSNPGTNAEHKALKMDWADCNREKALSCCSEWHRTIISLLQAASSDGLYDIEPLEHLKSACLPIV